MFLLDRPAYGATDDEEGCAANVLVAEDNPVNQQVAVSMLESLGCSVDVVSDGQAAVLALREKRYDVAFLDWRMAGMDGVEAAETIRREEIATGRGRTRLVALTANVDESDRARCRDAGMDDFVGKPFTRSDLRAALEPRHDAA